MGKTTYSGPIKAGTTRYNSVANLGYLTLSQSQDIVFAADGFANSKTFYLPVGAQIIDVLFDVTVLWDSQTSATGTIGYTAEATQICGAINLKTAVRARPTFTAAQVAVLKDITTNTTLVASCKSVGALGTTTGAATVTIVYIQK